MPFGDGMKKIVFAGEHFYPALYGGELSMLTLLKKLAKEYDVSAICFGEKTKKFNLYNIRIYSIKGCLELKKRLGMFRIYIMNLTWEKIFENFVKQEKPDLILTQGNVVPATSKVAEKYSIPTVIFVRSYEFICISSFMNCSIERHTCLYHAPWRKKIQYPIFRYMSKLYERALKNARVVFSNSKFTSSIVKKWYGVDSKVIYPFIDLENYRIKKREGKYITMIRPKIHKGVDIFIKIADILFDENFMAVGDTDRENELIMRKNIKYIPWVIDMKKVYEKTKILLVPSIWYEPFGRVIVEAMINGIPCIVSNRGGLQEAVGSGGIIIDDINNEKKWIGEIKKLKNQKIYDKLSELAIKQAHRFDFNKQFKRFEKIISLKD